MNWSGPSAFPVFGIALCNSGVGDVADAEATPHTLILHADEGSPGYAMNWYLGYSADLRFVPRRDIHHRSWNDVKGGG